MCNKEDNVFCVKAVVAATNKSASEVVNPKVDVGRRGRNAATLPLCCRFHNNVNLMHAGSVVRPGEWC